METYVIVHESGDRVSIMCSFNAAILEARRLTSGSSLWGSEAHLYYRGRLIGVAIEGRFTRAQ